jgi:hypothetical protein
VLVFPGCSRFSLVLGKVEVPTSVSLWRDLAKFQNPRCSSLIATINSINRTDGGPNRSMSQLDSCTSQIVHLERKPHPPFPSLVTCSAPRRQQPKCTCSTVPNAYHPQRNTRSEVFGAFWGTTPNIDKPHHPSIHPIKAPVWFDGSELGVS